MAEQPASDAARQAHKLLKPLRKEIVSLLKKLVRINSVAVPPGGNEAPAQRELLRALRKHRLDAGLYNTAFINRSRHRLVRRERRYAGRPNLIARLPGRGGGRSLLLSGHIDTVPEGTGAWKGSPWSGRVRGIRLYGRGAFDMKGGLVAGFAVLIALKRAGVRLAGDLLCESVVDEEWAGGGGTLAARLKGITADACLIAEGTGLSVYRATRGGYFFDLVARAGDPSAYFSKGEALSPAMPLGRLLGWVDGWRARRKKIRRGAAYRGFADPAPVQVLAVEAGRFDPEIPWSVPLAARVRVYFQFLPGEDVDAVVKQVRRSFHAFCRRDPFFRKHPPEWKPLVDPPLRGHELARSHPWTKCLRGAAEAVLRKPVPVTAAEYPCDAGIAQGGFGIPTLLFGPAGAGAHNVDEYVEIPSVLRTAEVLLAAALAWCG